jgi:hypothetical protein
MRDYHNFSFSGLQSCIDKLVSASSARISALRNHVVVSTTFQSYSFNLRRRKSSELFELCILGWYLGDLGWLLRDSLLQRVSQMADDDKYKIPCGICLLSEAQMKNFLRETTLWTCREFFGTYFKSNVLNSLRVIFPSKRIKKIERKRGYNDHGSRAEDSYWKQARNFAEDTLLQLEIEEERQTRKETLDFLSGFLE